MRMIAKRRMPTVILSRLKMQMKRLKRLRVRLTAPAATLPVTSSATSLVAFQPRPIPKRQAPQQATRSASLRTPPAGTRSRKRLRLPRPRSPSPNTRKISRQRSPSPTGTARTGRMETVATTPPATHLIRMLASMCVRASWLFRRRVHQRSRGNSSHGQCDTA